MSAFKNLVRDSLAEVNNATGQFVRVASGYREIISSNHNLYKPEANRYHLYVSYACPWANRCLTILKWKGLDSVISYTVVHPTWQKTKPNESEDKHYGWAFYDEKDKSVVWHNPTGHGNFGYLDDCTADPNNPEKVKFIRDLYEITNDTIKKYSVPVLWDKQTNTIVNNESADIVRMFNNAFNDFIPSSSSERQNKHSSPFLHHDFVPSSQLEEIEKLNDFIYQNINDGVYRCGFAKTQSAYDDAVTKLFSALDYLETNILSKKRYLHGNNLTESDIRLFMTIVRFDEVYVVYFKTNIKTIHHDYPNLFNYMKELYQLPLMSSCINMTHIKTHYYT
jgi:putative glutathione S-transferase